MLIQSQPMSIHIGMPQLDYDHGEMFQQFDLLKKVAAGEQPQSDFYKISKLIKEWSQYHFSHEDELMTKVGYAGIDGHRREHTKFINQISRFIRVYRPDMSVFVTQFHDVCERWHHNHIITMDRNLVSFIMSCDIGKKNSALSSTFDPFVERNPSDRPPIDVDIEWLG